MEYRIKLYGHTSADPETFCRNLADALTIGTEDAKLLLRQASEAPVIIADGIDEEEAALLENRLESIKALFISEPTGEDSTYERPTAAEASFTTERPSAPRSRVAKDDSLRWLAWSGVLAVLGGILILFVLAAFTSTYLKLERAQPRTPEQAAEIGKSPDGPSEDQIATETAELVEDIVARIDTLEREIPGLQVKLRQVMNDNDLPDRRSKTLELQHEIRARHREIRGLKIKLQSLAGLYEEK